MNDLVSVVIPTFNRAHTLPHTLKSVQNQTYQNWECFIVDDASTDDTEEVLKPFLKDSRFHFIKKEFNQGACNCRNTGLRNVSGNFIQFLDSDDLLARNKFEIQLKDLQNKPSGYISTCKWGSIKPSLEKPLVYDGFKSYLSTSKPERLLWIFGFYEEYLPPHVYLIPHSILRNLRWEESLKINQDGEFFTKVILNAKGITFTKNTFVLYRTGSGNRISSKRNTIEGIRAAIQSWVLIENQIKQKLKTSNHIYVQNAKVVLKKSASDHHELQLTSEEKDFLNDHLDYNFYKLKKNIVRIRNKIKLKTVPIAISSL